MNQKCRTSEKEVVGDIMKTDVFVKVLSHTHTQEEMNGDVEDAIEQFRDFERRMSRFIPESELSKLNASENRVVSNELFRILETCKKYFEETAGAFDPSILGDLRKEGYGASFRTSRFGVLPQDISVGKRYDFSQVVLRKNGRRVWKPRGLGIDLGGIGKGYIVDRVVEKLRVKYEHVFVYAGGDIRAFGENIENKYDFWVVDVENPFDMSQEVGTVLLRNKAVATSGVNRRRWKVGERYKHHLIDPRTGKSAETDIVTATVIADSVECADVWAKVLCIVGVDRGMRVAQEKKIDALLVDVSGNIRYTGDIKKFLWSI